MQGFADQKVEEGWLPEGEKEKFKVLHFFLLNLWLGQIFRDWLHLSIKLTFCCHIYLIGVPEGEG
jgi:hypothetical protein